MYHGSSSTSMTQRDDDQSTTTGTSSREDLTGTSPNVSPPSTLSPEIRSDDPSNDQRTERNGGASSQKPSVPLQRTFYPVAIVLIYCAAALYAWVIICILRHRPVGGIDYGFEQLHHTTDYWWSANIEDERHGPPHWDLTDNVDERLTKLFQQSERYLRSARVVQALVTAMTIPITSAICSQAAVIYLQRKRRGHGLSLRQGMALADKGWTDLALIGKLISGDWRKYGSALLYLGLLLHLLGFAISPVQQLFLSYKTIKRIDNTPYELGPITDIPDIFPDIKWMDEAPHAPWDVGKDIVKLRSLLASTSNNDVHTRLWSRDNSSISLDDSIYGLVQTKSQNPLVNLSAIADPFWAQLSSGSKTGMLRQFAPRVNSTAILEDNPTQKLPTDCHPSSSALYFHYKYNYTSQDDNHDFDFGYDIEVCMPGNVSISPWTKHRNRQDITEELYLRMNFTGEIARPGLTKIVALPGLYSRKLTLRTTMGYFELPNYKNDDFPGPLINGDPFPIRNPEMYKRSLDNDTSWTILSQTYKSFERGPVPKGPLLNVALALFGAGSFADIEHTNLAAYARSNATFMGCIGIMPLIALFGKGNSLTNGPFEPCLKADSVGSDLAQEERIVSLHANAANYFALLSGNSLADTDGQVENAFAAAAFLATDVTMTNAIENPGLYISYALGADTSIPSISTKGVVLVSALLGLDLLCLLAIALYSAWTPRWTTTLDSFAMMRIGASISEKVPLLATNHADRIKALDETPGWMGNDEEGRQGQLCLGGQRPLDKTKFYAGYETDQLVSPSAKELNAPRPAKRDGYTLASA